MLLDYTLHATSKTSRSSPSTQARVLSKRSQKVRLCPPLHCFVALHAKLTRLPPGRITRDPIKSSPGGNAATAHLRLNRKNNAKQSQAKKRAAIVSATRLFSGADGAPRIVAVIPLCDDVQAISAVKSIAATLDVNSDDCPAQGIWRLQFVWLTFL
jgi:hypothetical protein